MGVPQALRGRRLNITFTVARFHGRPVFRSNSLVVDLGTRWLLPGLGWPKMGRSGRLANGVLNGDGAEFMAGCLFLTVASSGAVIDHHILRMTAERDAT